MSKRDEILDVTEAMIRQKGYNAVSAREVATATGIKSSSVHYYFPNKTDMVSAVVQRYTENFLQNLGNPSELVNSKGSKCNAIEVKEHYIAAFRQALIKDKKLCLCAVLGAESGGLPDEVSAHTNVFFQSNIKWLVEALESTYDQAESSSQSLDSNLKETLTNTAVHMLAALEGAMIISQTAGDLSMFDRVANELLN
ncbi:MAG: TetR/AcrR family transcriptional regulator [Lentilitoribacter sp.]